MVRHKRSSASFNQQIDSNLWRCWKIHGRHDSFRSSSVEILNEKPRLALKVASWKFPDAAINSVQQVQGAI